MDDYVGPDNAVRFIEAFVDGLDPQALGFGRVAPEATGRPGYDPADLLKLCIYGYLNRVRSSRRLEAECHRNLEVVWLLRRLAPDFKTIADFRRDNRSAFRQVFWEFCLLTETAEAAREALGFERIDAVADRGYFKIEDIEACEAAGIVPYVPKPQRGSAAAKGFFTKDRFRYDAEADAYTCPGGQVLRRRNRRRVRDDVYLIVYASATACRDCTLKPRCTRTQPHAMSPATRTRRFWSGWPTV